MTIDKLNKLPEGTIVYRDTGSWTGDGRRYYIVLDEKRDGNRLGLTVTPQDKLCKQMLIFFAEQLHVCRQKDVIESEKFYIETKIKESQN